MFCGYITDKDLGRVAIFTRSGMRSVRAKWNKFHQLEITFPVGVKPDDITRVLSENRNRFLAMREGLESRPPRFHEGQVISCLENTRVEIRRNQGYSRYFTTGLDDNDIDCFFVEVPRNCDFANPAHEATVISCLKHLAQRAALIHVIPFAMEVAADKGCSVTDFEIGRGLKKLGHCTPKGIISLSANLFFFPDHLARYVICHELAHLHFMNHSADFHAECNRLCDGKEAQLEQELRDFMQSDQYPL